MSEGELRSLIAMIHRSADEADVDVDVDVDEISSGHRIVSVSDVHAEGVDFWLIFDGEVAILQIGDIDARAEVPLAGEGGVMLEKTMSSIFRGRVEARRYRRSHGFFTWDAQGGRLIAAQHYSLPFFRGRSVERTSFRPYGRTDCDRCGQPASRGRG